MLKSLINRLKRKSWKVHRQSKLNHELITFSKKFRENFTTLIISSFGVVAALTWQDMIKTAINEFFPQQSVVVYKLYVAVVVSVIAIIVTYFLSKFKGEVST